MCAVCVCGFQKKILSTAEELALHADGPRFESQQVKELGLSALGLPGPSYQDPGGSLSRFGSLCMCMMRVNDAT